MTAPSGPDTSAVTAFTALPSPLDSIDDLRAAARWMLAAAGAVGAALIGGGPLVAVGQVHGLAHAFIAGAALLVALIGVALAIWRTSLVLVPKLTTPSTLTQHSMSKLRDIIEASPADFFGTVASSVDDLLRHQAIAVSLTRQLAQEKVPGRRAVLEGHLRRAEVNAARAAPYARWLLATAHVWQIQEELRRARLCTLVGAVLVVTGGVAFFSVT